MVRHHIRRHSLDDGFWHDLENLAGQGILPPVVGFRRASRAEAERAMEPLDPTPKSSSPGEPTDTQQALQQAVAFDQAVAGIAATLMRVPVDAIDAHIVQALETVGELLGADRANIFRFDPP